MRILVINGPNLNLLGTRKPDVYGDKTLEEAEAYIKKYFEKVKIDFFQSNHEGAIIDKLHESAATCSGIVINPGAFAHYSYAIRDAIEAIPLPVIEVHLSNTAAREPFRHRSVITEVCKGSIQGLGIYGYVLAVRALAHNEKRKE